MKLARIVNTDFHVSLEKLAKEQLPLKVAFRLKGIIKKVNEEYSKYEEVRKAALSKYGKKDESGNLVTGDKDQVIFEDGGLDSFVKEINQLVNEEVDIPTIKLSELNDDIKLSLTELQNLDGLIIED